MHRFTTHPMSTILPLLRAELAHTDKISFAVPDPDRSMGCPAGSPLTLGKALCFGRSYRAWFNLAELLNCRMGTPRALGDGWVELTFHALDQERTFHRQGGDPKERYGRDSHFYALRKGEEPSFLYWFQHALERVGVTQKKRILDLGVHRGDELEVIQQIRQKEVPLSFVGIDHSSTAIQDARKRFDGVPGIEFYNRDINDIDELSLGRFDLILSIGTFQSPSLRFKPLLMKLVKEYLTPDGAMVLGFPNCRWIDGEMVYGAKAPHNAYPELSLLLNDVGFCWRYLQQHRFRVTVTGKEYLFLAATPLLRLKGRKP